MKSAWHQALLLLSLVAACVAFGLVFVSAEPPRRLAPFGPPSPSMRLQEHFAAGDWMAVLMRSDLLLDENAWPIVDELGHSWTGPLEPGQRRSVLLMRAIAAERYEPASEDDTPRADRPPPVRPRSVWRSLADDIRDAQAADVDSQRQPGLMERVLRLYYLAWAVRGLGDTDQAAALFAQALASWRASLSENPAPEQRRILAILLVVNGQRSAAFEQLARVSASGYRSPNWPRWTTNGPAFESHRDDPRLRLAVRVGRATGNDIRELMRRDREADAAWLASRAVRYDPSPDDELAMYHAILLERTGDPSDAAAAKARWREILEQAARSTPKRGEPLDALAERLPPPERIDASIDSHTIGWAFRQLGRPDLAAPYFEAYIELMSPGLRGFDAGTLAYNRACGHALLGRADDAVRELRDAARLGYSDTAWAVVDFDLDSLADGVVAGALAPPPGRAPEARPGTSGDRSESAGTDIPSG